jgi:glycosyltransferase involved in cell wall biosynthesis
MQNNNLAIVFLGAVLPEEECAQNSACSAASNKDILNLLIALQQTLSFMPSVLTVKPIGTFPKSKKLFVKSGNSYLGNGMFCRYIPFINILFIKQISTIIANLLFLMKWSFDHREKQLKYIIVHNVYPPMSIPVLIIAKLMKVKPITIVADLPHNLSYDFRGIKGKLQKLNWLIQARVLKYFSGIIAFTRFIGEDHAPKVPMLVMEGGVNPNDVIMSHTTKQYTENEKVFLFSGTLSEVNGVSLLLEAFSLLSDPSYRLWIFGRGPLEPLVRTAAAQDRRIVYHGFVSNQADVICSQREATLLINLRLRDSLINRYTFPSKLREYMLSGRPVISTLAPGIPEEYQKFFYPLLEETAAGLASKIEETCSKPEEQLELFGLSARDFILQNKNWALQAQRISKFLSSL